MDANVDDGLVFMQPTSAGERHALAGACATGLGLTIPALVDSMDNAAERAYSAWPERLYIVGEDGRIAYVGGKGPFGFDPEEFEQRLIEIMAGSGE
jgi:type I thyroxine 5'-deiodinase